MGLFWFSYGLKAKNCQNCLYRQNGRIGHCCGEGITKNHLYGKPRKFFGFQSGWPDSKHHLFAELFILFAIDSIITMKNEKQPFPFSWEDIVKPKVLRCLAKPKGFARKRKSLGNKSLAKENKRKIFCCQTFEGKRTAQAEKPYTFDYYEKNIVNRNNPAWHWHGSC